MRGFTAHVINQATGAMNDNIWRQAFLAAVTVPTVSMAAGGAVTAATDGDAASMDARALLVLVFIVPFLLLAPLAGMLADRLPRHLLIRAIRLGELVLVAAAGAALWSGSLSLMLPVLGLLGVQSALFGPVKMAVVPQLVPTNDLARANGWLTGTTYLAIMLGTGLAFTAAASVWQGTLQRPPAGSDRNRH